MTQEMLNFYIAYPVNVLDLEASLWRKVGNLSKILSYLSGTAIVASAINQSQSYAIAFSIAFAIGQCIDFVFNPQTLEQKAKDFCEQYKQLSVLLATGNSEGTKLLLEKIKAKDDIKVFRLLQDFAFNLTTDQLGFDEKSKYPETRALKLVKWFL